MAFVDAGNGAHDLTGCAVTALVSVVLDEGGLHRMQVVAFGKSFNRGDLLALLHNSEGQAGRYSTPIDEHSACAAMSEAAALFAACQVKIVAQTIE